MANEFCTDIKIVTVAEQTLCGFRDGTNELHQLLGSAMHDIHSNVKNKCLITRASWFNHEDIPMRKAF